MAAPELVGGIAPLAGRLSVYVADLDEARTWRGAEGAESRAIVERFHKTLAGHVACSPAGHGYVGRLGAGDDASIFALGDDSLALVGSHWELPDDSETCASCAKAVRDLVASPPDTAHEVGTFQCPSGKIVIADAFSDLFAALSAGTFDADDAVLRADTGDCYMTVRAGTYRVIVAHTVVAHPEQRVGPRETCTGKTVGLLWLARRP